MSVLPDHELRTTIRKYCMITPYRESQLQPASYDVRLGTEFKVRPLRGLPDTGEVDLGKPETYAEHRMWVSRSLMYGERLGIKPQEFMLGCTDEEVRVPDNMVMRIEGKSSIGRLGLLVHATAGYVDPGYVGRLTLELYNCIDIPIVLRPGALIAQVSVEFMHSNAAKPYNGRYQGDTGASGSRYEGGIEEAYDG